MRFGKLSQQVRRQTAAAAPGIQDSEVVRPGNLPEQLEAPSFLNCGHLVVSFPVPSHIDRSEFSLQVGSEMDLLQAKALWLSRRAVINNDFFLQTGLEYIMGRSSTPIRVDPGGTQ